jgi:hypothetical protein
MLLYNSIQQITFHQRVTILGATHSLRVVVSIRAIKQQQRLSEPGLPKEIKR